MGIIERKEREREARRSGILDAAAKIFKSKGFANATMDDIARDAELAKGTIYLYYKSKEELQIGLVMRGLDLMGQEFKSAAETASTAFEKFLTMGEAYWQFANTHPFYFATMHLIDVPQNDGQISEETLRSLHEQTNSIWAEMVSLIEQSKVEGMVRHEVNAFAFSMLLWMNTTSTLRFHHKVSTTPNSAWRNDNEYNPCKVNFRLLYDLNAGLLFHQIVTEEGRKFLKPLEWPQSMSIQDYELADNSLGLQPFAEETALQEILNNSIL